MIWVCSTCGTRWELPAGLEPRRVDGDPICTACAAPGRDLAETAALLRRHQLRPLYKPDGTIWWACKSRCPFEVLARNVRASEAEAEHQAEILLASMAAV